MSGIVGLVTHTASIDTKLLQRMTDSMAFRGPDGKNVRLADEAGLGHTLLRTTPESEREVQPCTIDGNAWLTADCRIDARDDLRAQLTAHGAQNLDRATDPELILHAWHQWGDECVHHLLGDFAFAIWDRRRRRLFCARDHWGIKLFYYSQRAGDLVFSNTLNVVRMHPGVSERWNELAICDFLLFSYNQEADRTTTFADIQCLPPAHTMSWEQGQLTIRPYWKLAIDEPIRYKRQRDYVERFHELLGASVSDRLRGQKLASWFSGGLDSTVLAATAKRVMGDSTKIRAYSIYYRELIPDDERHYAERAAAHLKIPVSFLAADEHYPYAGWDELVHRMPEPDHNPMIGLREHLFEDFRCHDIRVSFYGEGPDNLLRYEWKPYLNYLRDRGQYGQMAIDAARGFWTQKRLPFAFFLRRKLAQKAYNWPELPAWIKEDMNKRFDLAERWRNYWAPKPPIHPYHPYGYNSMYYPNWIYNFIVHDPGVSYSLAELRHPYMDLRVAQYLLALPVIPWCRRKHIMREAARDLLPEVIWRREKTPLQGDPYGQHHSRGRFQKPPFPPQGELLEYLTDWPDVDGSSSWRAMLTTTPISLGLWWKAQQTRNAQVFAAQ
jgi:asparagine synthase (glutamine-hydrolysing)